MLALLSALWCVDWFLERGLSWGSGDSVWVRNGCAEPIVVEQVDPAADPQWRDVRTLAVRERAGWGIGFTPLEDVSWRVGRSEGSLSPPRSLPLRDGPEGLPLLSVDGADCPAL